MLAKYSNLADVKLDIESIVDGQRILLLENGLFYKARVSIIDKLDYLSIFS